MQKKKICCYLHLSNMLIDILDNMVYITTPEQSESNSDGLYVIDDNGPSISKSTLGIEILNYINSKDYNLNMLKGRRTL